MTIEPIDKEFNEQLLTGKGLDSNLFSTKEIIQYYKIGNYEELKAEEFTLKLNQFIIENYKFNDIKDKKDFTLLFYKNDILADYNKYLYESARDNQNGYLENYSENLVLKIRLKAKSDLNKIKSQISFYKKNKYEKEYNDNIILE
jgi:hypothetical protein